MKATGKKRKADLQSSNAVVEQNVTEPPKNLLPEHTDLKEEPAAVNEVKETEPAGEAVKKTEEKIVTVKEEIAPTVDIKTNEIKNDEVIPASEVNSPPPPPPPISVPVSQIDISASPDQPSNRKYLWIGLAVFLILILGGTWFYLTNNSKKVTVGKQLEKSATPTAPEVEPTAVVSQEVKEDKYPIKVLNGSGIAGEASKIKEILEKEGFKVSETGNAENYDYTDTVVQSKKGIEKNFLEKLKSLIGKTYTLAKDELISASDSSDVIVIVGSKKSD